MSTPLKAITALAVGLFAVSAQAQLLGPSWEANIVLTHRDVVLMREAVTKHVHGKSVGASAAWANPASGHSGTITLEKKLMLRGQQCEEIAYTIRSHEPGIYPEHYHFTSCLQPDGSWKIA